MGTSGNDLEGTARTGRTSRLVLRAQPDERLVVLAREGLECAFEEIVRRYRPALVRFAATIVPAHQAEDAVQDALIRAQAALVAGDAEINLRAWLYTIVRNGAVSERRKIRPTEQLEETIDGVPQPPDIVERRENVRGVVARMKLLPAPQREALARTELGGASAEEISRDLGTTTGAVGQLVFRARATLRSGTALLLPMPLLRMLLSAPPGGGAGATATTGGVLAGALGGSGGSIAVKVGAAIVVAAIAVGPGRAPVEEKGSDDAIEIGGVGGGIGQEADVPAAEGAGPEGHERAGHATATGAGSVRGVPGGQEEAASERDDGGGGGGDSGARSSEDFDGGQVSSEPSGGSDGATGPAPAPPAGSGGHYDGGAEQPPDDGGGYHPPPDDGETNEYIAMMDGGRTQAENHELSGADDGYDDPYGSGGGGHHHRDP